MVKSNRKLVTMTVTVVLAATMVLGAVLFDLAYAVGGTADCPKCGSTSAAGANGTNGNTGGN